MRRVTGKRAEPGYNPCNTLNRCRCLFHIRDDIRRIRRGFPTFPFRETYIVGYDRQGIIDFMGDTAGHLSQLGDTGAHLGPHALLFERFVTLFKGLFLILDFRLLNVRELIKQKVIGPNVLNNISQLISRFASTRQQRGLDP